MIGAAAQVGIINVPRGHAIKIVTACAVVAGGAFAALGSPQWLGVSLIVLSLGCIGLIVPFEGIAYALAGLVPLQLYFGVPDSSFALRAVVILVAVGVARTIMISAATPDRTAHRAWLVPVSAFLFSALVAAFGAADRYLAFRGLYDWIVILCAAWVVSWAGRVHGARLRIVAILVITGTGEAILGLLEYLIGLANTLDLLRLGVASLVFQPNLLRQRLADLSFNWVVMDRVVPFGTFINGIDYAIFLATILSVLSPFLLLRQDRRVLLYLSVGALMGVALLLTYKGSGWISVVGGILTVLWMNFRIRRNLSAWSILQCAAIALLVALVIAVPFSSSLQERAAFLVQREQGAFGTSGRFEIWASLLGAFSHRPLFGYGLNNAVLLAEPLRTLRDGIVAYDAAAPESAYVAALVETGIIGFVGLVGLLGAALYQGYRNVLSSNYSALEIGLLAGLVALLLGNLTVAGLSGDQNGMLLAMLLGMVFGKRNDL